MRQRDPRHAVEHPLPDGGDRPRMVDVRAQVAAGVDPREDPVDARSEVIERQPDAVGRGARHGDAVLAHRGDRDRRVGRHAVPAPGDRADRGDQPATAQSLRRLPQRGQSRARPSRRRWSRATVVSVRLNAAHPRSVTGSDPSTLAPDGLVAARASSRRCRVLLGLWASHHGECQNLPGRRSDSDRSPHQSSCELIPVAKPTRA